MEQRKRLRALVEAPEILVLPGAYDALSAKIMEQAGFNGVYFTGYGQSASCLGMPDVGLLTMTEMAARAARTAAALTVPLVCDGDTDFGNAVNVVRTVREYERAGAAAIQLEDQTFPKKCGHMTGRQVIPAEEMAEKIRAAAAARQDPDFLIIARTDTRTTLGVEEAIRRARLYAEAGADLLFVESLESAEEMREVNRRLPLPTVANMVEGGRTPMFTNAKLSEFGYNLIIYPTASVYVTTKAMVDLWEGMRRDDTTETLMDTMIPFAQFNEIVGLPEIRAIEANYATGRVVK